MEEPTLGLADGLRLSGLSISELEFRSLTLGGIGSRETLCRHVDGSVRPDEHEHNIIAQALNEALLDRGDKPTVAYRELYRLPPPAP